MLRQDLKEVIGKACGTAGVEGEARTRLVNTADLTDRIAVGSFRFDYDESGAKCGCPATLAGYFVVPNEDSNEDSYIGDGFWADGTPEPVKRFPDHFDTSPELRMAQRISGTGYTFIPIEDEAPEPEKTAFVTNTQHPNASGLSDVWALEVRIDAETPEEAAKERLSGLGCCSENTPVVIRVDNGEGDLSYYVGIQNTDDRSKDRVTKIAL